MSIVLGIDTSSTDLSIGVVRDSRPIASFCRFVGNSHAEQITAGIGAVLDSSNLTATQIDRIAVAIGPGSFTGLRIGLAFIKGFCLGRDIPVLPVSSLVVLARSVYRNNGRVFAAIDARNNNVYRASFDIADGKLCRQSDDEVSVAPAFLAEISSGDHVVTDTLGWEKSAVFSGLRNCCIHCPVEKHPLQRGLICALEGAQTLPDSPHWTMATELRPNYLIRPLPAVRLQQDAVV